MKLSTKTRLLALTLIFSLSATIYLGISVFIKDFLSPTITITTINGVSEISINGNTAWTTTPYSGVIPTNLYTRFTTTTGGYIGNVKVIWQLQLDGFDVTGKNIITTTFPLDGTVKTIYASISGLETGNRDWGPDLTALTGVYQIHITFETA